MAFGDFVTGQVQSGQAQDDDNLTLTLTGVTAGNTLFVATATEEAADQPGASGVSSDQDGAFTRDLVHDEGSHGTNLYRLSNVSSGTHVVTINFADTVDFYFASGILVELEGDVDPTSADTATHGTTGSSFTVPNGTTVTAPGSPAVVVSSCMISREDKSLGGDGDFATTNIQTGSSNEVGISNEPQTTAAAIDCTWTFTATGGRTLAGCIAAYQEAGGATANPKGVLGGLVLGGPLGGPIG